MAAAACQPPWPAASLTELPPGCCEDRGACIAPSAVNAEYLPLLGHAECAGPSLCVPTALLTTRQLTQCQVGSTGAEGRCLSDCLAAVSEQGDRLERDGCEEHERCVPCYDPVSGTASGACSFGDDQGPVDPPVLLSTCCKGLGLCVPSESIATNQRAMLGQEGCTPTQLCAPRAAAEDGATYQPKRCTSSLAPGAEGRCLPACLPALAQQDMLARDGCEDGELCAPCVDPIDGEPTGSCALGADLGPSATPVVFPACCGELGRCVPTELVPAEQRAHLDADGCSDTERLCVPTTFLRDEKAQPVHCTSSLVHAEGRCLPACLPELAAQRDSLRRDTCTEGELCAPCFDPVSGADTGSCHLAGDSGPSEPVAVFDGCCEDRGKCVPDSLIPAAEREQLGPDTCQQPGQRCAPTMFLQDGFVPERCEISPLAREGRCLPACLPELAAQAAALTRGSCGPAELCAPCSDPFTGTATGSCNLGADRGPAQEEPALSTCCAGKGRCVPQAAVAENEREQLGVDECEAADQLCAPEALLRDPHAALASCTVSAVAAEGRCVPDCLPAVTAQRAVLARDGCPQAHSCVPCYEPLHGDPTFVCAIGGDPGPTRGPSLLASCCAGLGRCAPTAWVPDEFRSFFDSTGCAGPGEQLCVAPESALSDPDHLRVTTCEDPRTHAEGRCLPACLPLVATQADSLVQAGCKAEQRCVPCFDPLEGKATGACALGADPGPTRPATVFHGCCTDVRGADQGACVPKSLAPAAVAQSLPVDSCTAAEAVCIPRSLASDPHTALTRCTSLLASDGVCLPSCFLPAFTATGTCPLGEACAPCSQLGAGIAGC